jgi:hypothetical protein
VPNGEHQWRGLRSVDPFLRTVRPFDCM